MSPRTMYFKIGDYTCRARITERVKYVGEMCYYGNYINLTTGYRGIGGIFRPSERIKKPISTLPGQGVLEKGK